MEKKSLRIAYGEALVEEGRQNPDIVVLEADLGKSTMSCLFKDAFPERYFEMGIAEQNMASTAAGLALAGKIPFYSTFAVFAFGRAYDQIRCGIAIPQANVRICGSSCGLSDFGDGKTHQSIEDANVMSTIPNLTVLNPCDAVETRKMVKAMLTHQGPVYIRINRNDLPVFTADDGIPYEIGKMQRIVEGSDVVIFATGAMVWKSVEAAELLKAEGISVEVINVSTLKPLCKKEILKYVAGKKAIVVAEEATKIGGLGSTIAAKIFGEVNLPFAHVGIDDVFGTSAHSYGELLEHFGLTEKHIAQAARNALGR
ncbi:transketolase family protein [Propionivibrio dicarboxylicus]|uniref:Transketolase subunit B n=1 Tax=Propionivibrio dicarboxylicus TaxID=83767 RepID=A0A1G8N0Y8_9RHOO|nr:transketolase C-terminal domain-containing protein [Propionivibrio dicarboxylicus]SDI73765.1 transketolase subunit B [Propionivibrio dicarboxylicus]